MHFQWNENKNKINVHKHGISFETAQLVFDDPLLLTVFNSQVDDDSRYSSIGSIAGEVVIVVIHTARDDNGNEVTRLISARKASRREKRTYEQAN